MPATEGDFARDLQNLPPWRPESGKKIFFESEKYTQQHTLYNKMKNTQNHTDVKSISTTDI